MIRRKSREYALQILYQLDILNILNSEHISSIDKSIKIFWFSFGSGSSCDQEFTERLVRGVIDTLSQIDDMIMELSLNWRISRMSKVDKNLLRLGVFEILKCNDIPRNVSINEIIEISKRFSSKDSTSFINGILDKVN